MPMHALRRGVAEARFGQGGYQQDMLVQVRWQGRKMAVPLSQLDTIDGDESTKEGVGGFPESDWEEKVLAIGVEVKIKITGPCGRCVMTTLEQDDLPKDIGILKTAAKHNQARVGAYASIVQGGVVRQGDPVRIET